MFGSEDHVCAAVESVGAGGEDVDVLLEARHFESYHAALGSSDPCALHVGDSAGPAAFEFFQVVQKPWRIFSGFEIPLCQLFRLDRTFASLADSSLGLLVRQDRLAARTIIHPSLFDTPDLDRKAA